MQVWTHVAQLLDGWQSLQMHGNSRVSSLWHDLTETVFTIFSVNLMSYLAFYI